MSRNAQLLTIITSLIAIYFWTIIRFFRSIPTFDLVGQQGLVHQWFNGQHSYSIIGPTNYIWKMFLFYVPLEHLPGSPKINLLLLSLITNTITFIIIYFVLKKLYQFFFKKINIGFYLSIIWFALVSGSVYWIQFTNSRNIELGLGLLAAYLMIKSINVIRLNELIYTTLIFIFICFSDPLQIYMTIIPSIIYLIYKKGYRLAVGFVLLLGSSYILSRGLMKIISSSLGATLIPVTTHTNGYSTMQTIIHGTVPGIKQAARLFVGGHEQGWLIEGLNLLMCLSILIIFIYYIFRNKINKDFMVFVSIFFVIDMVFYIASGQSLQFQTSRYLIVTVPIFILVIVKTLSVKSKLKPLMIPSFIALLLINYLGLVVALSNPSTTSSKSYQHLSSVIEYVKSQKNNVAYTSIDSALPSNYFSGFKVKLLPLGCINNNQLTKSYLFYDKLGFELTMSTGQEVPIILDGGSINNYPCSATEANIIKQLGDPIRKDRLSDGSVVLIYPYQKINTTLIVLSQQ